MVLSCLINLPIFILGIIRTDKTITLPGDTTIVSEFVEIENGYKSKGTFETISVMGVDHSTILQNILASTSKKNNVDEMSEAYLHFSNAELSLMSQIQHTSSIMYSIIVAYEKAARFNELITLDYEFDSFVVSYYGASSSFKIGDRIIGINATYASEDFVNFKHKFNYMKLNDSLYILRDGKEIIIKLDENNYKNFGGYAYYNIDETTAYPKFKINPTNVGGPSGGLLQTLALYNSLVEEDITKGLKIAGTGTISSDGTVGPIGGIMQKIYTAYKDGIEIFLCPIENYEDALIAYNKLPNENKMKLYPVSTFSEALEVIKYGKENY